MKNIGSSCYTASVGFTQEKRFLTPFPPDKDMIPIERSLLQDKIIPTVFRYKQQTITKQMPSEFCNKNVRTILTLEKLGLIEENKAKASLQGVEIEYLVLSDLGCEVVRRCTGSRSLVAQHGEA